MIKNIFLILLFFVLILFSCKKDNVQNDNPNNDNQNTTTPLPTNLPDGNFEQWTLSEQGTYEEPSTGWWATLNILKNLGGPGSVFKINDVNTGNYAAKLVSSMWGDLLISGIMLSGTFDFNAPNMMIQGKPFIQKPLKLTGYYKYISVNSDSAAIYANITYYNNNASKRDTIAEARFPVLTSTNNYTFFEIDFNYLINNINPDSITIVFASSADGANFNGQAGSTLFIDDVSLILPSDKKIRLF